MIGRRAWAVIGAGVVTVGSLAAAASGASTTTPAATCTADSYDGATLTLHCTVPQATTTVPGPTVTAPGATVTQTVTTTTPAASSTAPASSSAPPPTPTATPAPAGAWPDGTSTGVPAGTALTVHSGSLTVTTAGAVVNGLDIKGCLTISAPSVVVKNTRVEGTSSCIYDIASRSTGLQVIDTEVVGGGTDPIGIGPDNFTALRVNVHGVGDGLRTDNNVTVRDSWVHGLVAGSGSHNDGLQSVGGSNLTVRHNRIENANSETSAVMIGADLGAVANVVIDGNLLAGGDYALYGGGPPSSYSITNIAITNNAFTTEFFPLCGQYGPMTATNAPQITVSGNYWADGPNVGKPVG